MSDSDTQAKLDKLAKIEQSGRDRANKYLKRQRQGGKKQISAILTKEAHKALCDRRDQSISAGTPLTAGDIISALLTTDQSMVETGGDVGEQIQDTLDEIEEVLKPSEGKLPPMEGDVPDTATATDDLDQGDYHGQELTTESKDKILIKLALDLPGPKNAQRRVDMLNGAGITCGKAGAVWDAKKFSDNLRFAKKRQGGKS